MAVLSEMNRRVNASARFGYGPYFTQILVVRNSTGPDRDRKCLRSLMSISVRLRRYQVLFMGIDRSLACLVIAAIAACLKP